MPQYSGRNAAASGGIAQSPQLAQMCGEDTRGIAGLPIDQIQAAIRPNDAQRAALETLANASAKAAQTIKVGCPTDVAMTAPGRLEAAERRIAAIADAARIVQAPLERLYDLLDDEQKARLTALGQEQNHNNETTGSVAQTCGSPQPSVTVWPSGEIEHSVHPTEAQRASLNALKAATDKAAETLKASCPTEIPLTPSARLAVVGKRLDTMLSAVKSVHTALDGFYSSLSDEQKAQFNAIGPRQASRS
jgi:hypothetical protein